jgi:hypothetical protein
MIRHATIGLTLSLLSAAVYAQAPASTPRPKDAVAAARAAPAPERPPLALRADFDSEPSETPVTMASIKDKELKFATYGPGKDMVSKTYHAKPPNEGGFIWTGACTQLCGFTVFLPDSYVDLTGQAKVTWRTEQTGLHQLRLMLKLADGSMIVSDQSVGASSDWQVSELIIRDLRWRMVDLETMNDASPARGAGQWLPPPDLSRVAEIGFTDLQAGSGHGTMGGSSRVKWIEVYGKRLPRS